MEIKIVDNVVTIICNIVEGKVLMQAANVYYNHLEECTAEELVGEAKELGTTPASLLEAAEEAIIVLPHEDNAEWVVGTNAVTTEGEFKRWED